MKEYQDQETGKIWAFDDGIDPFELGNRNIPKTLSETVVKPPSDTGYVWLNGAWVPQCQAPQNYKSPVSSVPTYNPAWVTFMFPPYTIILPDHEGDFRISFEDVINKTYDAEKLSTVVTALSLGKHNAMAALVTLDGAIAIPRSEDYPSIKDAINALNRILCAILIGGQHVEALDVKTIVVGSLESKSQIFVNNVIFHNSVRFKDCSRNEMGVLLNHRLMKVSALTSAHKHGIQVLDALPGISPIFILRGYSALLYRNLPDALANLWIFVEQLVSALWIREFLSSSARKPIELPHRMKSMKEDSRTWSIAVRLELLWQISVITDETYKSLTIGRKARNDLAHGGVLPKFDVITQLWNAMIDLMESSAQLKPIWIRNLIAYIQTDTGRSVMPLEKYAQLPEFRSSSSTNFDEWNNLAKSLEADY